MTQKYSRELYDKENMARVIGKSLPISTKFCVEICNLIRYKNTTQAKKILNETISLKKAIPFKMFNGGLAHKRSIGPGRFPKKAATEIVNLLESVEANAQFKGLNTSNLSIIHINAHLASRPWHYGRQRRRKSKRTHLEIVVAERKTEEKPKENKDSKTEVKERKSPTIKTKSKIPKKENNVKEEKNKIKENEK